MVRFLLLTLLTITSLLPFNAFAQDAISNVSFEAYIDRETVSAGETFQIKLELIEALPEGSPDLTVLPPEITVASQQQQQNVSYVNDKQIQNNSWVLDIISDKEGTYRIPAIEVKTNAGALSTKPFMIYVKAPSEISSNTIDNSVFIEAQVETLTPYINEPVLYKTSVYNLGEISQAELVKPKAENATVEQISQPAPSRQILNGVNYKMIEVEYLITPTMEGAVTIEPTILRGQIAQDDTQPKTALDDIFAPFGGSPIAQPQKQYTPFTVASKKITLNVKPAEASVSPWLALHDLKIDDEIVDAKLDEKTGGIIAVAGEPITRKIRLTAYGKSGESLPDIEEALKSPDFKIYADKPEASLEVIPGEENIAARIKGIKSQSFTFIPQRSGELKLPDLTINYWSLKSGKPETALLPGKIVSATGEITTASQEQPQSTPQTYSPVAENDQKPINIDQSTEQSLEQKLKDLSAPQKSSLAIFVIAFSICIIMLISFKALMSAKSGRSKFDKELFSEKKEEKIEAPRPKKIISSGKKPQANTNNFSYLMGEAASFEDILLCLQKFAESQMQMPKNSATMLITSQMLKKYPLKKSDLSELATKLDAAIYAGKKPDFAELKKGFVKILSHIEKINAADNNSGGLADLNP